jgi:hypothetical protein
VAPCEECPIRIQMGDAATAMSPQPRLEACCSLLRTIVVTQHTANGNHHHSSLQYRRAIPIPEPYYAFLD